MVETREALISSGITSALIAGTYLAATQTQLAGQNNMLAAVIFGTSFALSYTGMKGILPI